jgi:molybdopterin molybdotransferase
MVCFELFVRTAVRRIMNLSPAGPVPVLAELETDFQFSDPRPTYLPARLEAHGAGWRVKPVDWKGSFDLKSTASSNALLVLPAGPNRLSQGELVEAIPFTGRE